MGEKVTQADPNRFAVSAEIRDGKLWVTLADETTIGTPLYWYPFLDTATPEQLNNMHILAGSILWPDLDEGLAVDAMFLPPNDYVKRAIAAHKSKA
jgi:hypothetical protein